MLGLPRSHLLDDLGTGRIAGRRHHSSHDACGQSRWYSPYRRTRRGFVRATALTAFLALSATANTAEPVSLGLPVAASCLTSPFGPRSLPGRAKAGSFHNGIDLPAPLGAPVRAVAPGTIMKVQRRGAGGLEMLVRHGGFVGVYSHLGLIAPAILTGRRSVGTGDQLGTVGRSGLTYGPHLYFGILVDGRPVDPAPLLGLPVCAPPSQPVNQPRQ